MSRISTAFLVLVVLTLTGCSSGAPPTPTSGKPQGGIQFSGRIIAVSVAPVTVGTIQAVSSYSGGIQPKAQVNVLPKATGRIEKLPVDVGNVVHAGDVIAQLEQASAQVQVQQAQAGLAAAAAKLATMKAGSRPEDIATAEAAVLGAQAKMDQLTPLDSDISGAQASLASAQAAYNKAQSDLNNLKTGPTPDDITVAKADLEKKQAALQKAQADYDKIAWRGDIASRPEAVALQQATADYQSSLAAYNLKIAPPKPDDLAAAQKNVESAAANLATAQSKLDQLKAGPKPTDLAAAQAALNQAKNQLELKRKPYTAEDIQGADAAVAQAQAAVDSAKLTLSDTTIVAPFDGIIASRSLSVGSLATTQNPIVSIVSQDVELQINVEESRIGQLQPGLSVALTVPAYPGTSFSGSVAAITPVADSKSHTFLVKIALDNSSGKLSSGMFGDVKIMGDRHEGALLIPKDALIQQGDKQIVFIAKDGQAHLINVQTGASDDKNVEILDGLSADDQVIVAGQSGLNDGDRIAISGQSSATPGQGGPAGKPGGQSGTNPRPGASPTPSGGGQ